MNRFFVKKIQKRLIRLLKSFGNKPLYSLSKDSCSEIARLVGCWVLLSLKKSRVFIYKGDNVLNKRNKCHDLLVVERNSKFYLLDPSIWQFFKYRKSIFLGEYGNLNSLKSKLANVYRGSWKLSEVLGRNSCKNIKEWQQIIKANISED